MLPWALLEPGGAALQLRDSESEETFRAALCAWLARAVPAYGPPPPVGDWSARRAYDTGWQGQLHAAGYAGVHWPRQYGGRGASPTEQLIYHEETARAGAPYIGANFIGMMHGGPTLMVEGTPEQKGRHLPAILRGEQTWCQGFSEPEAGSDLAALRSTARREGDHYVVDGRKIWTTRAQIADYCELLVRTDPGAPRHGGLSWLILPMHLPGIGIRPLASLEGEGDFSEVFLDGVRVPVDHRVGRENDGWRVANVTLRFERGTAFGAHIASLQRLVGDLRRVAGERVRGPGPVWGDVALRRELGRLQAELDGLWALVKRSVCQSSVSGVPALLGSAIKLAYADLHQRLGELAVRLLGRAGLAREDLAGLPCESFLHEALWSLSLTIAAGSSQIQRNIVSERILGLPRETRGNTAASGVAAAARRS